MAARPGWSVDSTYRSVCASPEPACGPSRLTARIFSTSLVVLPRQTSPTIPAGQGDGISFRTFLNMGGQKAIIVGLSGCSSSGKTTLARLLRDIFPNSFVLHEDDFYRPEDECVSDSDSTGCD